LLRRVDPGFEVGYLFRGELSSPSVQRDPSGHRPGGVDELDLGQTRVRDDYLIGMHDIIRLVTQGRRRTRPGGPVGAATQMKVVQQLDVLASGKHTNEVDEMPRTVLTHGELGWTEECGD